MIFSINFFLFGFAQSNILIYACVYAKHYANITNAQYGVLAMILPALAIIVKPICCSITDANGTHLQFLVGSLAVFGASYGSLGILPFFKDPHDHATDTFAWIVIIILMGLGYLATACVCCMNDALASNYARKHNVPYSRMRVYGSAGWAGGALLVMIIGEVPWLPTRVPGCLILALTATIEILMLLLWPYKDDFEMFHDGSTVEQRKLSMVGPNTAAFLAQRKSRGSISRDIMISLRESRSKSVGNIPSTDVSRINRNSFVTKEKTPEPKEYSNFQCQMILLKLIAAEHKSFIKFIVLFTVFGTIQAMVWNFELDFFQGRLAKTEAEFEFVSTLSMIAQSLFGDILAYLVASDMIRVFGANANFSLALVCIGLRCFCYGNLLPYLGKYYLPFSEALEGPSLALYYVLAVDVGSNYALMVPDFMPEMRRRGIVRNKRHEQELSGCLRATMIGIMSTSAEGLGVALGSLIGGSISSSYGYYAMWNFCAILGICIGFMNFGWDIITKLVLAKRPASIDEGDKTYSPEITLNIAIPTVVIEDTSIKVDGINGNGATKL